jgi:predicted chitinase
VHFNTNYGNQMSQMNPALFGGVGLSGQNPMMAMMAQMLQTMMSMMAMMQGGSAMSSCNPGFGNGQNGFGMPGQPGGGGPLGGFLGGSGNQGYGNPGYGGGGGNYGAGNQGYPGNNVGTGAPNMGPGPGQTGPVPGGPSGRVGNVDINRLVSVLPQSQQNSARQHFPFIVQEAQKQGVQNKAQLAYILATATHESGAGKHMEEFASGRAYEGRRSLGNTQAGDGVRFKGRGYVQLTGRRNYTDWSRRLGMDLVGNPRAVENPQVAAKILVGGMMGGTFTGRGLGSYINGQQTDFVGARRTVNGTDRAGSIAQIAQRLMSAL